MSILEFRLNYNKHGMCCCNTTQTEAFIVIGATALITGVLWRSAVLAPIKLVKQHKIKVRRNILNQEDEQGFDNVFQ